MATQSLLKSKSINRSPYFGKQLRNFTLAALVTLFASLILAVYLSPFAYMVVTSLKDKDQIIASARGPILPVEIATFEYEGEPREIYNVPQEDGSMREMALLETRRRPTRMSIFVDPEAPEAPPYEWEGRIQQLEPVYVLSVRTGNFADAWERTNFPRLLFNTSFIAISGVIGTLLSSICVAYAFARFPIPGKRILFMIVIATIVLPRQVMLVPMFALFSRIGWTGTWLPLIVPHFFSNGYNVFLMRQYFAGLPRELDEAALIDGAGPFRVLTSVIIPQSWPVIVAVGLFHMVFAWNDFFEPLIYTLGNPRIQPIAVAIQLFNQRFSQEPHIIQSTALLAMLLPVILFFAAQRVFMRGVVITGVEK